MWNDTNVALAYLITFRCYGTWLHGDERGSTDRDHNVFGTPFISPNETLNRVSRNTMRREPVYLSAEMRQAVLDAIREVCVHRKWKLRAVHVRTNHAHIVCSIGSHLPAVALNALKAYSTRKLRERGLWNDKHSPWSDKGSERWLWTEENVWNACDYVTNGQGNDLRDFDSWVKQS